MTGLDNLDKVVHVDQAPIGRTPRSNPATYTGVFDRDPHAVQRDARGEGPRLPARPLQLQRQGRPLRGLRGRRHDQDRDELPARRVRRLRGLPRQAVQPRHARGALQGQEHRRGARDADRGGGRLLRADPGDPPLPADAGRRRPRLRAARPVRDDPLRRRGAAREARDRAPAPQQRPQLYVLDEPTTGLHFEDVRACSRCSTASSTRATR